MRVLHIMASKGRGGAEIYAVDIMLSLQQRGLDNMAVVSDDGARTIELLDAGVRVDTDVLDSSFRFIQRRRLAKLIEQEKPDLIHCWMRRAAELIPAGLSCPVIGWFAGYNDPKHYRKCSHFIGITKDVIEKQTAKGVDPSRLYLVPTFPDVRDDAPVDRASLGTPADALVILALSRLHPTKALDTLIKAAQNIPDVYVWLAGDGPLQGKLEALVRKLGLAGRVKFLGWRTDRGALLRAADLCALPSRSESFGTVILEAWAAGTPLVAAASAGPAGHIVDGENGLLVPIDDVSALTIALKRGLHDEALRRRMIAHGFECYSRSFTRKAVTDKMVDVYSSIVRGRLP